MRVAHRSLFLSRLSIPNTCGAFLTTMRHTAALASGVLRICAKGLTRRFCAVGALSCGQMQAAADSHRGLQLARLPGTVPERRWQRPDCRRFPM